MGEKAEQTSLTGASDCRINMQNWALNQSKAHNTGEHLLLASTRLPNIAGNWTSRCNRISQNCEGLSFVVDNSLSLLVFLDAMIFCPS
jgi:hypothetical protein